MDVVKATGVTKWYGNEKVLDGIDFIVEQGEVIGVVGPNGCGKTTLLKIIARLIPFDKGTVKVNGRIGFVFQEDLLLPWRPLSDNILVGLKIRGYDPEIQRERLETVTGFLGIKEYLSKYPSQVSGGTARKAAIARALVLNPDILLLDEPYTGLDVKSIDSLQETLMSLKKERMLSMVIVSHQLDELVEVADKIYVFTPKPSRVKTIIDLNESRVGGELKEIFG